MGGHCREAGGESEAEKGTDGVGSKTVRLVPFMGLFLSSGLLISFIRVRVML